MTSYSHLSRSQINIIRAQPGENLWEKTLAQVAAACTGRTLNLPGWVLPDNRHRHAAEIGLCQLLNRSGISIQAFYTPVSLASTILKLPVPNGIASSAAAILAIRSILARETPETFLAVSDKPGFAAYLWRSIQEAEARGYFPNATLNPTSDLRLTSDFKALHRAVHQRLNQIGLLTSGQIILYALQRLQDPQANFDLPTPFFLGPFAELSSLERELFQNLLPHIREVHLALPPYIADDFSPLSNPDQTPPTLIKLPVLSLKPLNPEKELNAIFAIIARWVAEGQFRYGDIRLIHPFGVEEISRLLWVSRRYQVPVRTRLRRSLAEFPSIILWRQILDLFDSGWNRSQVLAMLRSRLVSTDDPQICAERNRFINVVLSRPEFHALRSGSAWVAQAQREQAPFVAEQLGNLANFEEQKQSLKTTADLIQWLRRLAAFLQSSPSDGEILEGESDGGQYQSENRAAWQAFDEILNDLDRSHSRKLSYREFIADLEACLREQTYFVVEQQQDAVDVVSHQTVDHLPTQVVIYPALSSRVPAPERFNPVLQTSATTDFQANLRRFWAQVGNAKSLVLLSCPQFDDQGDPLSPSPFLNFISLAEGGADLLAQAECWQPYQALPGEFSGRLRDQSATKNHCLHKSHSLQKMHSSNKRWSPTRLATALQCRYLHFAQNVLALQPQTDKSIETLTPMDLGRLAHKILEEFLRTRLQGEPLEIASLARNHFESLASCYEPHLEIDRAGMELVRCMSAFVQEGWSQIADGFSPRADQSLEAQFRGATTPFNLDFGARDVQLEGKIDRLDLADDNRAILIDYKYKKLNSGEKGKLFEEMRAGYQPQLPLYWLAAERLLHVFPVAMLQFYLRSQTILGFRLSSAPLIAGESEDSDTIRLLDQKMLSEIISNTLSVWQKKSLDLLAGDIAAYPRDFNRCGPGNCAYADLCRLREWSWRQAN